MIEYSAEQGLGGTAELLASRLTPEQIHALEAHVNEEKEALGKDEPLSVRLATEFHILLAEMTGSIVLARYSANCRRAAG